MSPSRSTAIGDWNSDNPEWSRRNVLSLIFVTEMKRAQLLLVLETLPLVQIPVKSIRVRYPFGVGSDMEMKVTTGWCTQHQVARRCWLGVMCCCG